MMGAADKKQVREMLKNDTVFRRQATQFIRAFDKILSGTKNADNPDNVATTLLKTDLGQIYAVLKANI